jgi:hypothetical protein
MTFGAALKAAATAACEADKAMKALKIQRDDQSPPTAAVDSAVGAVTACYERVTHLATLKPAITLGLTRTLEGDTRASRVRFVPDIVQAVLVIIVLSVAAWPLLNHVSDIANNAYYDVPVASGRRPFLAVGVADLLLIALLIIVLFRCEQRGTWALLVPYRITALFILVVSCVTFVCAVAQINLMVGLTTNWQDSLYQAFLTVTTFSHDAYKPDELWSRWAVAIELFSVVLMFFVLFPLLVSRLAMFTGEAMTPGRTDVCVCADTGVRMEVSGGTLAKTLDAEPSKPLRFEVDELGEVTGPI